jgi:hypothetical protein
MPKFYGVLNIGKANKSWTQHVKKIRFVVTALAVLMRRNDGMPKFYGVLNIGKANKGWTQLE